MMASSPALASSNFSLVMLAGSFLGFGKKHPHGSEDQQPFGELPGLTPSIFESARLFCLLRQPSTSVALPVRAVASSKAALYSL